MATCYIRHSKIPVEEDLTHEFKAHRDLSDLDLSEKRYTWGIGGYTAKAPRYRATLSKSICGMLNTGLKSTIYLGVTDDGIAEGFMMSLYQKDHFQLSLRDLLSKFQPSCPEHVIKISFIPILDEDEEDGEVLPDPIGLDTPRWLHHRLRDSAYCWCDNLTMAAGANGFMHRFYVIELTINQWDKNNPKNANLVRDDVCDKRPIFANEFGKIFIRRNGYVREVFEKHLGNLKQVTYSGVPNPKLEELPKTNMNTITTRDTDDDDENTEFFSYDSDSNISEIY